MRSSWRRERIPTSSPFDDALSSLFPRTEPRSSTRWRGSVRRQPGVTAPQQQACPVCDGCTDRARALPVRMRGAPHSSGGSPVASRVALLSPYDLGRWSRRAHTGADWRGLALRDHSMGRARSTLLGVRDGRREYNPLCAMSLRVLDALFGDIQIR